MSTAWLDSQSPLLKIPFLVAAGYGATVALTSPSPPPQAEEQKRVSDRPEIVTRMVQWGFLTGIKGVFLTSTALEIAAILAAKQLLPFSREILLRIALLPRSASNIRLTRAYLFGWLALVAGAAIRGTCYRVLGRHFTFHLSVRDGHSLVTSGPYSVVRHPSYSAGYPLVAGLVTCAIGSGSWARETGVLDTFGGKTLYCAWAGAALTVLSLLFKRAKVEDEALKRSLPEEWEAYAKQTPYKMFPYIW
ncbi:hypothetical protein CERSUDRAFT_114158 [Gelatoporia subvermispora B]|uniref:Protein-S-isoprenylcysteine O-methyltransferase n=1 Tax=Ceriporiopsis subvermispora (strain B) TaxID=914234 RepID=M2QKI6_CERS8|nr:hypothetical protein CERSUDRAFT_114158 [Gelatoporia subvermispora B]